ncbi:hypothetical protein [Candidatus Regiella insecticola]|uniref:hypothetical protein n=1 Tax=Candidatus Regiella insecticola TaxID=138073 RepID=UPI0030D79D0E
MYFVVSYWAPELSEKMATAAAKLAEGQSEATQAKIGAGQEAATALINGGSQTVAAMTAGVGYILGWFGAKTNQTKRASAAINAGAVAAAHTEQISYQCNNPPIAQLSSTLSASIVAAFFGIDGSSKIGMAAADGAVLGDKWAAFLTCLSYGDIRGSLMLLAGHKMVDVGLSFLPKGIEKSTIQEYAGPVLKNAINVLCLDLKSQVIIMILPAVTSTMLATWCAFQQKPEGWLKQKMEQGRASALAAAKNVAESATETAKGAVVCGRGCGCYRDRKECCSGSKECCRGGRKCYRED